LTGLTVSLTGCTGVRAHIDALHLDKGTVYTGNLHISDDTSVVLIHEPKAMRDDEKIVATVNFERKNEKGVVTSTQVQIRKLQEGGYSAETGFESKGIHTYLSVAHTDSDIWILGLRWHWKF
jgi:hypothetical protein